MSQHYRLRYSCDMVAGVKYRDIVRETAFDQYGFFTTRDAIEAGIPAGELPKLAARGGLENVAYGLYRVPEVPPTDFDQFAEAIFRVGEGAYLHRESVLTLFRLADVNPRQVSVAVARRVRSKLPAFIRLTVVKAGARTTIYHGIRSQLVVDALIECQGRIERERLYEAAAQARTDGLLTTSEWQLVQGCLGA